MRKEQAEESEEGSAQHTKNAEQHAEPVLHIEQCINSCSAAGIFFNFQVERKMRDANETNPIVARCSITCGDAVRNERRMSWRRASDLRHVSFVDWGSFLPGEQARSPKEISRSKTIKEQMALFIRSVARCGE